MRAKLKRQDIERIFSAKKQKATSCFVIRWQKGEVPHNRVAFAFSAKHGNAVLRNRFKRKIRALFDGITLATSIDSVILAKRPLAKISDAEWHLEALRIQKFLHETSQCLCHPASSPL